MEKYLEYLGKDRIKIVIFGLILGKIFEIVGIGFYTGVGILGVILLVLNLKEKKYFVGKFKIRHKITHKDICK